MPEQEESTGCPLPGGRPQQLGRRQIRLLSQLILSALIGIAIIYVFIFVQLPYYTVTPGSADELRPMVHLQTPANPERGTFMLTTVSVMDTNLSTYVWGKLTRQEIHPKSDFQQNGESEQDYNRRQEYIMTTSQSSAIQAAYRKAQIPYHIRTDGVMVLQTLPGMPAAQLLQAGDYIDSLDNLPIKQQDELLKALQGKQAGDVVAIGYRRGQIETTAEVRLELLPSEQGEKKAGLGILTGEMQSIQADDPNKQITIDAGDIGGPSAGLMFSLEAYNQLVPEDITKGYRIAGTGEITPDGKVGVIGGIQHKVVAADRQHADIFFAPNDYVPENGAPIRNASDAIEMAERLHTRMKIVPVGTMQDALDYLASLPPKPAAAS